MNRATSSFDVSPTSLASSKIRTLPVEVAIYPQCGRAHIGPPRFEKREPRLFEPHPPRYYRGSPKPSPAPESPLSRHRAALLESIVVTEHCYPSLLPNYLLNHILPLPLQAPGSGDSLQQFSRKPPSRDMLLCPAAVRCSVDREPNDSPRARSASSHAAGVSDGTRRTFESGYGYSPPPNRSRRNSSSLRISSSSTPAAAGAAVSASSASTSSSRAAGSSTPVRSARSAR